MKQRVISSLIGLILLAVVVFLYETPIFVLVITLLSLVAVYELLNATQLLKYKTLAALGAGFSLLLPFVQVSVLRPYLALFIFLLLIVFFVFIVSSHGIIKFEQGVMGLFFSFIVPLFFGSAVYLRDEFGKTKGLYLLLFALGSAWLCDTGAYFSGYFFGKHKMAPIISPKKTVEGAVGGVLTAVILNLVLAYIFTRVAQGWGHTIQISYLVIGLTSPFIALLGMLGDLVASVIKRQYKVKDYGHIMPGHGGVMDRFDSVLLTFPAVYVVAHTFPIFLS